MSEKRYPVYLSAEQRQELHHLIHTGKSTAHQQVAARVLLKADESNEQPSSSSQIAEALEISPRTVIRIKQRFVQQGLATALSGNYPTERPLRRKVAGRVEAHLIALACGPAPQGQRRWTMQLLADRVVDLGIVDQISDETLRLALKKTNCVPG
jgi:Homeodomain-like domain